VGIGLVGSALIAGLVYFILPHRQQRNFGSRQLPYEPKLSGYTVEISAQKAPEKYNFVQERPAVRQELSGRERAYDADATLATQAPQAYDMDARRGSFGR
jgi:hypothetical protein